MIDSLSDPESRSRDAAKIGPQRTGPALVGRAHALIFDSPHYAQLRSYAERLARSDVPVLIIGELGSGKLLLSQYLHYTSERRGAFVALSCKAMDDAQIEAELFGSDEPDVNGARSHGCFDAAAGGTLFLDEIEELSANAQARLLRVLQERQILRQAGRVSTDVDVRLIVAAGADLGPAVESGAFRSELFYHLNIAPVPLLPIRARTDDIMPIARYFASVYGPKLGHASASITLEAEALLHAHPWSGNIRELENVIHYALIVSRDGVIDADDLRLLQSGVERRPAPLANGEATAEVIVNSLRVLFRRLLVLEQPDLNSLVERILVTTAYEHFNGNQVQAARGLSVSRNVVRTLLKRVGLISERAADDD
jgi:sigma-54 dependent transcriptional regulator